MGKEEAHNLDGRWKKERKKERERERERESVCVCEHHCQMACRFGPLVLLNWGSNFLKGLLYFNVSA